MAPLLAWRMQRDEDPTQDSRLRWYTGDEGLMARLLACSTHSQWQELMRELRDAGTLVSLARGRQSGHREVAGPSEGSGGAGGRADAEAVAGPGTQPLSHGGGSGMGPSSSSSESGDGSESGGCSSAGTSPAQSGSVESYGTDDMSSHHSSDESGGSEGEEEEAQEESSDQQGARKAPARRHRVPGPQHPYHGIACELWHQNTTGAAIA